MSTAPICSGFLISLKPLIKSSISFIPPKYSFIPCNIPFKKSIKVNSPVSLFVLYPSYFKNMSIEEQAIEVKKVKPEITRPLYRVSDEPKSVDVL